MVPPATRPAVCTWVSGRLGAGRKTPEVSSATPKVDLVWAVAHGGPPSPEQGSAVPRAWQQPAHHAHTGAEGQSLPGAAHAPTLPSASRLQFHAFGRWSFWESLCSCSAWSETSGRCGPHTSGLSRQQWAGWGCACLSLLVSEAPHSFQRLFVLVKCTEHKSRHRNHF